jgi:hypothetical protein
MDVLAGGEMRSSRFVPGMASEGFLLNPLIADNNDVVSFYQRKGAPVDAVTFRKPATASGQLSAAITVRIFRVEQ